MCTSQNSTPSLTVDGGNLRGLPKKLNESGKWQTVIGKNVRLLQGTTNRIKFEREF